LREILAEEKASCFPLIINQRILIFISDKA